MEEILTQEQPTFKTMFAKLNSLEEYTALNNAIGKAKSYPDERSDTNFYSDPNPIDVDGLYYMQITAEVQDKWSEILQGIELINQIPQSDDSSSEEVVSI